MSGVIIAISRYKYVIGNKKKSEYFDVKHLQKIRTYSLIAIFYILIKKCSVVLCFFVFYGVICCQVNLRVNLLRIWILEKII